MSANGIKIAPSLLAADFADLKAALEICRRGDADYIHLDVMDGSFVPNITIGPAVIRALRPHSDRFFDVHIMVCDPLFWIEPFARAGADGITFHVEAAGKPGEVIDHIRSFGIQAGISLKPGTNIELVEPFLARVDLVLVMSVEPGFGGQTFLTPSLDRIRALRRFIDGHGLTDRVAIQVDGGIGPENAGEVRQAGADILVAGSAIFAAPDPLAVLRRLKNSTPR